MEIQLKLSGYRCFPPDQPATIVLREGLTALIGLNNTGKSAFLRSIYELRHIFSNFSPHENQFRTALLGVASYKPVEEIGDYKEIFWHFDTQDAIMEITLPAFEKTPQTFWKATIRLPYGDQPRFSVTIHDFDGKPIAAPTQIQSPIELDESEPRKDLLGIGGVFGDPTHLIRAFRLLSECFYCPSTRHATAFTPDSPRRGLYDLTIGKPFIEDWLHHLQGRGKTATETIQAVVTDIEHIFRYKRLQIIAAEGMRELLVLADGKSFRLSDLGNGLSQFIVLLGNIAFSQPSWVLIDEPELNLHPALQSVFLQAIAIRAAEGVVFATHSLGLARQDADKIYTFSQEDGRTTVMPIERANNLAQLIGEMSFGRVDFSARRVLLVEGPTDILTFEALLSLRNKEHLFAIMSLGGGDYINASRQKELQQITALNLSVFAIIDSEKDAPHAVLEKPRKEFQAICSKLNIDCHVLTRRATENYFTDRALRVALRKPHYRELKPYESLDSLPNHWPKRDNWRVARAMQWSEIEQTDLGQWIDGLT